MAMYTFKRTERHSDSDLMCSADPGTPSPDGDPGWTAAADNILIGVSQVTAMAAFAARGEFENFADADIPYSDIELAVNSAQQLLGQVCAYVVELA